MANAADMTITVETRTVGLWRVKIAVLVCRWVRPARFAAWLACWLTDGKVGVDLKVGAGKWECGPRAEVKLHGD